MATPRLSYFACCMPLLAALFPSSLTGQSQGRVSTAGGSGAAGGTFNIAVTLSLNSGVSIDTLSFGAQVIANGSAPALSGALTFTPDGTLPPPTIVDRSAGPNLISVAWLSLPLPLTGTQVLGVISMTIPAGAQNGQTYTLRVTGASATRGNTSVPLASGPDSTLTVSGPALALSVSWLAFTAQQGGATPGAQTFQVLNSGSGTLSWSATLATEAGGNWLAVSPASGVAPSTLTVTATPASLDRGAYAGRITIAAPAGATQALPVVLAVDAPVIGRDGVVNGASFSRDAVISPGSIASMFGLNLAGRSEVAGGLPLPIMMADTQVLVKQVTSAGEVEIAAPLFFVSPSQINFQMPAEAAGSSVPLTVVSGDTRSLTAMTRMAPEVPGIFTVRADGTGPGAVLNQDFSLNSAQNPAEAGSVIQIFATGLGATDPPLPTGQAGASSPPFHHTVVRPAVLMGGVPAETLFSGMAPNFVGLYQVNARVPAVAPGSSLPLQIRAGGRNSNTVEIAVR